MGGGGGGGGGVEVLTSRASARSHSPSASGRNANSLLCTAFGVFGKYNHAPPLGVSISAVGWHG